MSNPRIIVLKRNSVESFQSELNIYYEMGYRIIGSPQLAVAFAAPGHAVSRTDLHYMAVLEYRAPLFPVKGDDESA